MPLPTYLPLLRNEENKCQSRLIDSSIRKKKINNLLKAELKVCRHFEYFVKYVYLEKSVYEIKDKLL